MQQTVVTVGPLVAASANNIATSQTPSAGALTLNGSLVTGGVAILDTPRQVLLTFAANETGHNFVVSGTDWANSLVSETVAGTTAGTVPSVLSYKTVTSIVISANATGAITVGTNAIASSPWIRLDGWASPTISKQLTVNGTVNYTVQQTMDDPNAAVNPVSPSAVNWINDPDLNFVAQTANAQGYWSFIPIWARVLLNSGSGSVTMTVQQSGSVTY